MSDRKGSQGFAVYSWRVCDPGISFIYRSVFGWPPVGTVAKTLEKSI
jgi:hypothetical protein